MDVVESDSGDCSYWKSVDNDVKLSPEQRQEIDHDDF